MPGEERKFKRRRMVAFLPACKRERASAAAHASALDGVSVTGTVVFVGEGIKVGVVVCWLGVEVSDGGGKEVAVIGTDDGVAVDDAGGNAVGVSGNGEDVPVGEGGGGGVAVIEVPVGD